MIKKILYKVFDYHDYEQLKRIVKRVALRESERLRNNRLKDVSFPIFVTKGENRYI